MRRELLPIGTVVKLKGTDRSMMICGFAPTGPSKPGYVYDYSGFLYPEGYGETLEVYQFDNEQIELVQAIGYQDRETFRYMEALQETIMDVKEKTAARFAENSGAKPKE